jgi:predicted nucleic acid-binding protein
LRRVRSAGPAADSEAKAATAPELYALAMSLAERHQHHLFDTLYHALALRTDQAVLVTADERYARKAMPEGRIVLLRDFARRH